MDPAFPGGWSSCLIINRPITSDAISIPNFIVTSGALNNHGAHSHAHLTFLKNAPRT